MINLRNAFSDHLQPPSKLAIMPVSRLLIAAPFRIDRFLFIPAGGVDFTGFEFPPPADLQDHWDDEIDGAYASMMTLRNACTAMTGGIPKVFQNNTSVAFVVEEAAAAVNRTSHQEDVRFLSLLSQKAERAMDWIRFNFCRFDLPATLPGVAGSWTASNAFVCACILDFGRQPSEFVAGEAILHSIVSKGLGLELDEIQCARVDGDRLPSPLDGEVGSFAQHALRLFSDALNANTNTNKFLRAMTLLEFLAVPFEYQKLKESKKDIAAHVAGTHQEYIQILNRFHQLSDLKSDASGNQEGYRTLMIHHGRFLEEILPDIARQRLLFREIQSYTSTVIHDFLDRRHLKWTDICDYRRARRESLAAAKKTHTNNS
jgi:hypothetical protein